MFIWCNWQRVTRFVGSKSLSHPILSLSHPTNNYFVYSRLDSLNTLLFAMPLFFIFLESAVHGVSGFFFVLKNRTFYSGATVSLSLLYRKERERSFYTFMTRSMALRETRVLEVGMGWYSGFLEHYNQTSSSASRLSFISLSCLPMFSFLFFRFMNRTITFLERRIHS